MHGRNAIVDAWYERTVNTYPAEARPQLMGRADQFRSPVGFRLRAALETLLDELAGEMNVARVRVAVDDIVRLRAVQDFAPSDAIGFVFFIRDIAREQRVSFPDHEQRIDQLALIAFDTYMQCREQVAAIRAREAVSPTAHMRCRA